jgi:hypothetical protein
MLFFFAVDVVVVRERSCVLLDWIRNSYTLRGVVKNTEWFEF